MYKFKTVFILIFSLFISANLLAQEYHGKQKDIQQILKNIDLFSQYYRNGEVDKIAACYTDKGKLLPKNMDIIAGEKNIKKYWTLPEGVKILKHKITPLEIKVIKKYAYDYGYYEGETLTAEGKTVAWKGKYVIVWKKVGKNWKMYLDIWNGLGN